MPEKRRKTATAKHKEAKARLIEEAQHLETQLMKLQPEVSLKRVLTQNAAIMRCIRELHLDVAWTQSALATIPDVYPLCTPIQLSKDWEERRATLLSIRDKKLVTAYEYLSILRQAAQWQPFSREKRVEMDNGDVRYFVSQLFQFPGVRSLKHVYDAIMLTYSNVEISISERLGHITVRDDYECMGDIVTNSRVISTDDMNITTEMNFVVFSQFFDPTGRDEDSYGIIVIDHVDEDELYPYSPHERVRKDAATAFLLTATPSSTGLSGVQGVNVTVQRAGMATLHYPQFHVTETAWQSLLQHPSEWGDVIMKAIRSALVSNRGLPQIAYK